LKNYQIEQGLKIFILHYHETNQNFTIENLYKIKNLDEVIEYFHFNYFIIPFHFINFNSNLKFSFHFHNSIISFISFDKKNHTVIKVREYR